MNPGGPVFEVPEVDLPEVAWWLPVSIAVVAAVALALRGWPLAQRLDLGQARWFRWLVARRVFPFGLQVVTAVGFLGLLAALQLPRPEENVLHPGLVLAWGVWWNLFLLSLLFAGRSWCAICPIFFLGRSVPHLGRRWGAWGSVAVAGVLYLALGMTILLTQAEADATATAWILGGLVVGGVVLNRVGPGLAWCRSACPALVFARVFEGSSFVGPGRERQLSCTLVGGPVPLKEALELAPSECSLCLRCGRVQPVLSAPRHRVRALEKGWMTAAVFCAAWAGVALEIGATRLFWAELTLAAERFVPWGPGAVVALVLAAGACLAVLARLAAGTRSPALLEAATPLLLGAVLYQVLFSGSHHLAWGLHHLDHLLGLQSAAFRMREGLNAPPLIHSVTMAPAGLALAAAGTVHALVGAAGRARAGALPWRALALILLLGAALAWLLWQPYVEAC